MKIRIDRFEPSTYSINLVRGDCVALASRVPNTARSNAAYPIINQGLGIVFEFIPYGNAGLYPPCDGEPTEQLVNEATRKYIFDATRFVAPCNGGLRCLATPHLDFNPPADVPIVLTNNQTPLDFYYLTQYFVLGQTQIVFDGACEFWPETTTAWVINENPVNYGYQSSTSPLGITPSVISITARTGGIGRWKIVF